MDYGRIGMFVSAEIQWEVGAIAAMVVGVLGWNGDTLRFFWLKWIVRVNEVMGERAKKRENQEISD